MSECLDPRALGVHPAAEPASGAGGRPRPAPGAIPVYVRRDADDSAVLAEGFASGGLIIIEGPSAAGKTRMAFEAMHRHAAGRQLIVPDTPAALRELKTAGVRLADAIVWLDDINGYLAAGDLDAPIIDALCPRGRRDVLLLATLRSDARRDLDAEGLDSTVRRAIREVTGGARIIHLGRDLSPAERRRAERHRAADARIADALDQHTGAGFAEHLAAAPAVLRRWQSARDSAGGAIITAAVDARRAGFLSPLPRDLLFGLNACYLGSRPADRDDAADFDKALAWATEPVQGAGSCLAQLGAETYEPFDYLLDHAQATGSTLPATVWPVLLAFARPSDVCSVAIAAYDAGHPDISETALRRAAGDGHAAAMHNLGVLLEQGGRREDAEEWYRRAAGAGDAGAMYNLAVLQEQAGHREEAEEWYRRAAGAGHARAMNNLGALLHEMGRVAEAQEWYRRAAAVGHPRAMNNLGALLHEMGRVADAEEWYRRAADAGHVRAMNNLAIVLHETGRAGEAERWYRQVAATGDAGAMYNLGVLLEEAANRKDAEQWYRKAADTGHARAMNNLGALLQQAGHRDEAEEWYRLAAAAGQTGAMYNLGVLLEEAGSPQEAEQWYRHAAATGHAPAVASLGALLDKTGLDKTGLSETGRQED